MARVKNILLDIPRKLPHELLESITQGNNVRIERIVSQGHITPEGEWYDSPENEFVILENGEAELLFEESNQIVRMRRGDYINIPPHARHRVVSTSTKRRAIWLAIYYK